MKPIQLVVASTVGALVLGGAWVALVHPSWVARSDAEEDRAEVETVVPVRVEKVQRVAFHRWVEGWGTVAAEPAREGQAAASARVASPASGVLSDARCAEGQKVEKGATLFQLDTRLASAEAQKSAAARAAAHATVDRLKVTVDFAGRELDRSKKLAADKLASDKDLQSAELELASAQKQLAEAEAKVVEAEKTAFASLTQASLLRVQAPLSGTVVKVNVNPGEAVEASTILAEIVDLDRLIVAAAIPASNVHLLKVDQPVELLVGDGAAPDEAADAGEHAPSSENAEALRVRGRLAFIGLAVDPKNDSVPVRIAFPKDAALHPGQYVRLRVMVEEHAARLAVHDESLVRSDDGYAVAVVEGDRAKLTAVSVGLREGTLVEISGAGIALETTVARAGAYGLPKATRVRVVGP